MELRQSGMKLTSRPWNVGTYHFRQPSRITATFSSSGSLDNTPSISCQENKVSAGAGSLGRYVQAFTSQNASRNRRTISARLDRVGLQKLVVQAVRRYVVFIGSVVLRHELKAIETRRMFSTVGQDPRCKIFELKISSLFCLY